MNRYAKKNLKKAVANGSDADAGDVQLEEAGARWVLNPNYQRVLDKRLNSGKAATEARAFVELSVVRHVVVRMFVWYDVVRMFVWRVARCPRKAGFIAGVKADLSITSASCLTCLLHRTRDQERRAIFSKVSDGRRIV